MTEYEDSKYFCDINTLKSTAEKYGVAIIPNVLTDEECQTMVDGIWGHFEHITQNWETPIKKNDKKSWRGLYRLFPMHSMLFQHWNVGHCQAVWDLRQKKEIVDIFSKFWKCKSEDLLVSFDGLSFHMPPEETRRGWNRNNTWYHTDQSFTRPKFECLQSWVTGLDVEDGDATLAFYEGSHKLHNDFGKRFEITDKKDWYKLTHDEEQFFKDKCLEKKIKCPKGSLVFWDSRTIHCGVEAYKDRKNKKFRAVVYLCYQPRQLATKAMIKKKQKAFNEMRLTSHWPCKPKLFPKNPRTYGQELPDITPIEKPKLTKLGKFLAGF
jgi:hypothetical protein